MGIIFIFILLLLLLFIYYLTLRARARRGREPRSGFRDREGVAASQVEQSLEVSSLSRL